MKCACRKKQIQIPKDVQVKITGNNINVTGKHGTLERTFDAQSVGIEQGENTLDLKCLEFSKKNNSYYGLMRALIQNMVNRSIRTIHKDISSRRS